MSRVLIRQKETDTEKKTPCEDIDRQGEDGSVKVEGEIGVMLPQAKEHQGLSATIKS